MSSSQSIADFILEQAADAGRVALRRMFGEYALYCNAKTVALICDDQLYMKPTKAGRDYIGDVTEGHPFPGAKAWFLIDEDKWEDADWLCGLIRLTAAELPVPKTKAPKAKSPKKKATPRKTVKKQTKK